MSIINQTLKELDRRQGQQQATESSAAFQSRRGGWPLRIAVFGAVILLAAIFVVLLLGLLRDSGAESEMLIERQPVNVQPESVAATAETEEATVVPVLVPATQVRTRAEDSAPAEPATEPTSEPQPAPDDVSATPADTAQEADSTEQPAREGEGQMQVQRVERDAGELAQQKLDRAVELLEQGEGRRAEQLLQEALVLNPESVATRQQLAAYYYGRGFSSQALRLLRDGLSYAPNNARLVMLKARIYEESNRPDEALRVLKGVRATLPQHADLVTLRGALANETGDYREAAASYQALVDWRPTNGVWWLGLGIARDYLEEPLAARAAYSEALNDPNLNEDSRRFALQRLEAL
ncbi:tetratricopeptide repeat protein [Aliidiomarina sp. Khilg15.8]